MLDSSDEGSLALAPRPSRTWGRGSTAATPQGRSPGLAPRLRAAGQQRLRMREATGGNTPATDRNTRASGGNTRESAAGNTRELFGRFGKSREGVVLGARSRGPGGLRQGAASRAWRLPASPAVVAVSRPAPARPAMKQEGASRRRGDKAKAPPDGPPPAPPDVEMQEEATAAETAGERQPQRELDAITLEGEGRGGGGAHRRGVTVTGIWGRGVSVGGS